MLASNRQEKKYKVGVLDIYSRHRILYFLFALLMLVIKKIVRRLGAQRWLLICFLNANIEVPF